VDTHHSTNRPPARQAIRVRRKFIWFGAVAVVALGFARQHYSLSLVLGDSMEPTFGSGALLLVHRRAYQRQGPKRGDLVLARCWGELVVKRVVGLPGEDVEVRAGNVYINNALLEEDHARNPGGLSVGPGRLTHDSFALLGDNRSLDRSIPLHSIARRHHIHGRIMFAIDWRSPWFVYLARPDGSARMIKDRRAPSDIPAVVEYRNDNPTDHP
jgi:signal peptidase I